jgi:Low molecular weight phosphotyrosine protein phosphatase
MTETTSKPSVLFGCVKNSGKSQMAAGLMTKIAGASVQVHSAGTKPGTAVNDLSAQALAEVGVDITGNTPMVIESISTNRLSSILVLLAGIGGWWLRSRNKESKTFDYCVVSDLPVLSHRPDDNELKVT